MWTAGLLLLVVGLSTPETPHAFRAATNASADVNVCTIEENVDYIGNDLSNTYGSTAEACCDICHTTRGCSAFSWSSYNGGTCWLKTTTGDTRTSSGVRSAQVTPGTFDSGTCAIEEDVDYIGNDLGSASATAAEVCCEICADTDGCNAFSWNWYNGGTCWLKTGKGDSQPGTGTRSAQVNKTMSSSGSGSGDIEVCSVRSNVDYPGNDIGHVHARTAELCCDACQQTAGCSVFSWTNYQNGECWLKGAKGNKTYSSGVRAGVVAPLSTPPTSTCSSEVGVSYVGNDLHTLDGYGIWDCCTACNNVPGCVAYTWTNSGNSGTCYLKSARTATIASPSSSSGTIAGYKGGQATLPPVKHCSRRLDDDEDEKEDEQDRHMEDDDIAKRHVQHQIRAGRIPVRAVNLGGWLVGEYWMTFTSPMWNGANSLEQSGEYVVMQHTGHSKGDCLFDQHRQKWITESDIKAIAKAGINTVRVPVGFWIADDIRSAGTRTNISRVYAPGALQYLDALINEWAFKHNVAVMLSLHAHQGSQNGNDHSAPQVKGQATWGDSQANFNNSVAFATALAKRYKDSAAFLGMGLMNEPTAPAYDTLLDYYEQAYQRIRKTGNKCILTVAPHLSDQSSSMLNDFMRAPNYTNVWVEWHVYYKWGYEGQEEASVVAAAKRYADAFTSWTGNPVFMGEWSLGTAEAAPFKNHTLLREFAVAQLQSLAHAKAGWAFWTWKNDEELLRLTGWSMRQLIDKGIMSPSDWAIKA